MVLDPTTIRPEVRAVSGMTEDVDIADAELDALINIAIRQALDDIYIRRWEESLVNEYGNTPTIDDSNTTFYVDSAPIADYDNDGAVTSSDITVTYYDVNLDIQTADVVVVDARRGKLTITTDGSTPLPEASTKLRADYYSTFKDVSENMLRDAVIYLSCHLAQLRMSEPDKISLSDMESSRILVRIMPTRFLTQYKDKIRRVQKPRMRVL
jgi:hypothetical protein